MKKYIFHIIAAFAVLICLPGYLYSQTGTVEGYVKNGPDGDPVSGISIYILNPAYSTTTNESGYYSIADIESGITITVSVGVLEGGPAGSQRTIVVNPCINKVDFWLNAVTDIDGNSYSAVEIGNQVWMAENLKTTKFSDNTDITPVTNNGSWVALTTQAYCWYLNDPSNKNSYGALYNWYAVNSNKLCPSGWYVPSNEEWTSLVGYLNFEGEKADLSGGRLKEAGFSHWTSPNYQATNLTGFTALPGGNRNYTDGTFSGLSAIGAWWSSSQYYNTTRAYSRSMSYQSYSTGETDIDMKNGYSVRCVKGLVNQPRVYTYKVDFITTNSAQCRGMSNFDGGYPISEVGFCYNTTGHPTILDNREIATNEIVFQAILNDLSPNTTYFTRAYATNSRGTGYGDELSFTTYNSDAITDIDGNFYNLVNIGLQVWLTENLKTTKYNNGNSIPLVTNLTDWMALSSPAYSWYNNDVSNNKHYGAFYNWYTVNTGLLCPTGWHVPSDEEWTTLAENLSGSFEAGGKLKDIGIAHWTDGDGTIRWDCPNTGATNESGFTALPYGSRTWSIQNGFSTTGENATWWTATENDASNAWARRLTYNSNEIYRQFDGYTTGTYKPGGLSVRCIQNVVEPTLTTKPGTIITYRSANTGGDIVNYGGSPIIERGVCWNTSGNPTVSDNHQPSLDLTDSFINYLDNLAQNTTFYVRAYATNIMGTGYGNQISFKTTCQGTVFNVGHTDVTCFGGSDGDIGVGVVSGGTFPFTLVWTGPDGFTASGLDLHLIKAGTYNFTSTDGAGCIQTGNSVVDQPSILNATVTPTMVTCNGANDGIIAVTAPSGGHGTYEYTINGGASWSDVGTFGNIGSGTYKIQIRDAVATTCIITLNEALEITEPAALSVTINGTTEICQNTASPLITLTAENGTAPYTFTYTINEGGSQTITTVTGNSVSLEAPTDKTGTFYYSLESVKDASPSACFQEISEQNVTVTVNALPVISAIITNETCTGCTSGAIDLTVTGGTPDYTFEWTGPEASYPSVEDLISIPDGAYNVTVTDAKGCIGTLSAEVLNPLKVTNTDDDELIGSLRSAITYANGRIGPDEIVFDIPGEGPFTIKPKSALPEITEQVEIDGFTQRTATANTNDISQGINSVLMIELDGTEAGEHTHGLTISADNCGIRGLVINRFSGSGSGIYIRSGISNKIEGNFLGANTSGTVSMGNNIGVQIDGTDNFIGGTNPNSRNLISGNNEGVLIGEQASGNYILGNYIGIDVSGKNALPNSNQGVNSDGGHKNYIGGTGSVSRNIISGNGIYGIYLNVFNDNSESGSGNNIKGNIIGLTAAGDETLANGQDGIRVDSRNNVIGGNESGDGNIISGNGGDGIHIWENIASGNLITGNFIGIDVSGYKDLGNTGAGIRLNTCANNIVGGADDGSRNIISGNGVGIIIQGPGNVPEPRLNTVIGNYIGTDKDGLKAIGNNDGLFISAANNNKIGGDLPGERNIISGNTRFGIILIDDASQNEIMSNYIGTNIDGTSALPNFTGIHILGAQNNIIGGTDPGEGNLISGNSNEGILVYGPVIEGVTHFSDGNKILGNYIGLSKDGVSDLGNGTNGIRIDNRSRNNTIGGATTEERNYISGNGGNGVALAGPFTRVNHIIGNYIGTDISGKIAVSNNGGINITGEAYRNFIGGPSPAFGNLIANNNDVGIWLMSDSTTVTGNEIRGHSVDGIFIAGSHNLIGGTDPGMRNYLNDDYNGIRTGANADFNRIEGNFLGTDRTGKIDLTNGINGIALSSSNNEVLNNLISGYNRGHGLYIQRWDLASPIPSDNRIEGNFIGLDFTGNGFIPNQHGISINSALKTKIFRNKIAGNQYYGIVIADDFFNEGDPCQNSFGNRISENSIYSNGLIGINLSLDDVTSNDYDSIFNVTTAKWDFDYDKGPNNLQNYPVIDSLNYTSGTVYIKGHLTSAASSKYALEFFASKVGDNTGYGEGRTFLGTDTVTTNIHGNSYFSTTFPRSSGWGDVITATATDADGNTSEFSMAVGGLKDQMIATTDWPVHFKVNEEGIPRISDGSDITAVTESFLTWENIATAKIDFVDDKTTPQRNASATDGVNLVSFTDELFPFPKGVLAMAAKTLRVSLNDDVAFIIDADIVVNPEFVLHDVGVGYEGINKGYYDAQSIITHEIGHILGLIHTGVVSSTMFFMLDKGTSVRTLEQDDRSWASYKYPGDTYSSLGSISGKINYGEETSLPPVAGALVIATKVDGEFSVHSYSDAEGKYTIPGLPPGDYNISIQPLDGDVYGYSLKPGNISTYIYCNTIYTDYPFEYLSEGDSEVEPATETPLDIPVSEGPLPTAVIDIVTNKDLTKPVLKSIRPTVVVGNQVDVMSDFVITFSEPVDMTTFTDQTCYIDLDGKKLGGSWMPLADTLYKIYFNPGSELGYSKSYTLYLTAGIKDIKGNTLFLPSDPSPITYSFNTADPDNDPPAVISTYPANGADTVFVTAKVKVLFSESMNTESVKENFALTWEEGDPSVTKEVEGAVSWDSDKKNLTFTSYSSLREDEEYTILIRAEVTDLFGNDMVEDSISVFKTVKDAAPEIKYLGPKPDQTNVTTETPIVVDFTEPIDPSTVSTATFSLKETSGTSVSGTFDFLNSNSRVVFRPETNLTPGTRYTISITNGISDVYDPVRFLVNNVSSSFTTAQNPVSPVITYLDPANGKAGSVVTIVGSGFAPETGDNTISFNGITAYATTATLNTLTTEVPMGTLSGPVTVTVNNRVSNQMQFTIISDYENDPTGYVVTNTKLGSSPTGGSDIGGVGEAVFAMVTNPDANKVTWIKLGDEFSSIPINVGLYPLKVDIDPQGKRAYVTNFGSHDVSVIDLITKSVIKTIPVGENPFGVIVTPNGKRVYVSNSGSNDLSLIDTDPSSGGYDHVVANVPIGSKSGDIVVTGDAGVANVRTGSTSGDITVTGDAGMVLVTGDFGLFIVDSDPKSEDYNSVIANVSSGTKTNDVTVTADAGYAIVSTDDGSLVIINLHPEYGDYSGAVIANVPTGTKVSDVQASGDAIYIYATDTENDQILVYKFSLGGTGSSGGSGASGITLIPLAPIKHGTNNVAVGDAPEGLLISPAGDKIYTITGDPLNNVMRRVTTISLAGLKISPENSIESLIATVQTLINNNIIKLGVGNELVKHLTNALNYLYAGDNKNAISSLNTFIVKVNDLIKSRQITSQVGQPLVNAARAIVVQLGGKPKSGTEEYLIPDIESGSVQEEITETKLGTIYPNPSKEGVTVSYEIAENENGSEKVTIQIYDVIGRLVSNLVNENLAPGRYTATWNGNFDNGEMASRGYYFVRLSAGKTREVKQILLVR